MKERRPLIIQGTPGGGKSWLCRAVATRACAECHRTYWITFSDLLEDLRSRKIKDTENGSKKYGKRIRFYSDLFLCIDEFFNSEMSSSDVYILQDLFNSFEVKRKPFLICTQYDLNKLPEMVGNNSLGQSIKGRILGRAKIVSIVGPDIRLMAPDKNLQKRLEVLRFGAVCLSADRGFISLLEAVKTIISLLIILSPP